MIDLASKFSGMNIDIDNRSVTGNASTTRSTPDNFLDLGDDLHYESFTTDRTFDIVT